MYHDVCFPCIENTKKELGISPVSTTTSGTPTTSTASSSTSKTTTETKTTMNAYSHVTRPISFIMELTNTNKTPSLLSDDDDSLTVEAIEKTYDLEFDHV